MDLFTEAQILILIICAIMALAGYKLKQPGLSFIAMVGLFIVSMDLYNASSDLLLLGVMLAAAISQFFITLSYSVERRR